jgi:hypothetical protein
MRKNYICLLFLVLLLTGSGRLAAQVLTYTVTYSSSSPTATDAANWAAYRATLLPLPYYKLKVIGSATTAVTEINNPSIVQDIAMRLNTYNATTGGLWTWVDGSNTWLVGNCSGQGPELAMNSTSNIACQCPSPGYVVRSACLTCPGNAGGWGTATCGTPVQTITVEFWYGTPCPTPTGKAATNLTSQTADLSWNAMSGSTGYDYFVDQSPAYPPSTVTFTSTTGTSFTATGLTPSTTYYLHIRNKCSSTSISIWDTLSFKTLPPCKPPIGFNTTNLTPTSTTINWAKWPSALTYDYLVDQSPADPIGSTGTINTALNAANISGLTENTCYYVHIRSKCAASEISDWSLDSFCTPIVCRAPEISIDYLNTDEAVAYWAAVPTAYEYEYALSTSSTPPAIGTIYKYTSLHTSALNDGKDYYIHVRSHCNSLGVLSTSPWASKSFKTFATSINSAGKTGFSVAVYPNPVKDLMGIEVSGIRNGDAAITVTDATGKVVRTVAVTKDKFEIDMSGLASGVYFVKYADQAKSDMVKITKQ